VSTRFEQTFVGSIRAAFWLAVLATTSAAQGQIAVTQISAQAADAQFQVDGEWFTGSALFSWPAGSKHVLTISPFQYTGPALKTRYLFAGWTSSNGPISLTSTQVLVTADPTIASYTAQLTIQYAVSLSFYPCSSQDCQPPGTVSVNGIAYPGNTDVWVDVGSTVTLSATPSNGYIFVGWQQGSNLPLIYTFTVNAPTFIYPEFVPARAVVLTTSPDGLQLLADRAPVTSPTTLEWGWNTTHTVGVTPLQRDNHGVLWIFQSWSDGGAVNHSYQVAPLSSPASLTAQFVPAVGVTLLTNPPGLTLVVDGTNQTAPVNVYWAAGSTHTVAAPPSQTDSSGAPWTWRDWSNGGTAVQTLSITQDQASTGIRLTADYNAGSTINVTSVPTGLSLTVDGSSCVTPCSVQKPVGTSVTVAAPASVEGASGVRYDFAGWVGAANGVVVAAPGLETVTAQYQTMYELSWSSRPANTGSWQIAPPSPDGFFPANTQVAVTFTPATGWQFQSWSLDLSGTADPATIVMAAPHNVQAVAVAAPTPPAAPVVVNAASQTTDIAPGSLATLYGPSLANATATASTAPGAGPLPQSLAGVTLVCAGQLLPLLYVSPQQVNFLLPSDLSPGPQTLQVSNSNGNMLTVNFQVVASAPGLFSAVHSDGTAINATAPTSPGETISVYGTGFGAYQQPFPDGFPAPNTPPDPLSNTVQIVLNGESVVPAFAGAAPGMTGVALMQFSIPSDFESGTWDLAVTVSGAGSNTISIPVN
jgi:uncharacterized protein (TIGR03437 family)